MFYMVTGIVIGVIVAAVLIYPTVRASFSHKNSTQVEDYKEQILAKDTQLKASEKKVKEAKAAQKKAEDELDEYIGTSKKDGVYDLLLSALQKYSDRDYTGSADALLDIDSQKLTTKNMKAIYKDLTAKVYPSAGTGLYSKGKNAYWAKDYKTAISYLTKAIKVSDTNRYAYDYLAKAYEGASDQKNAKKTYQIKDIEFDFKNSGFIDSSGIGVILGRYRQVQAMGGTVKVSNMSASVRKIIHMAGLHQLIEEI